MEILILDGSPLAGGPLGAWLDAMQAALLKEGIDARRLAARDLRVARCRGCFDCWVRTPGVCGIRDDMPVVLRASLAADLVVLASPVTMGFTSALLKRLLERMLPQLHPYLRLVNGEFRHKPRYAQYPRLALVLGGELDAEDRDIIEAIYREVAKETGVDLALTATIEDRPEEVARALARLERLAPRAA